MIWDTTTIDVRDKVVYLVYGGNKNDVPTDRIVDNILNIVKKEHLLLKFHPLEYGVKYEPIKECLIKDRSIPWELVALNNYNEHFMVVSFTSNSLTNPGFYWGISIPTVSLADCKDYNAGINNNQYVSHVIDYCKKNTSLNFPESEEAFNIILQQFINEVKEK